MADRLNQLFLALSDATRRKILARLSESDATVSELAKPFLESMSLPAVVKHLQVLESAGLIQKTKRAQERICHLNVGAFNEAMNWIESLRSKPNQEFDRIEDYLKTLKTVAAEQKTKSIGIS